METKKDSFPLAKTEYTILPFSENRGYYFKNVKEATLSTKELIEIEELLQKMIVAHNSAQAKALVKYNKENPLYQEEETGDELETNGFKRQYLPVINAKEEKEVWINFFCKVPKNLNWKTAAFSTMSGGNCYYRFKINLSTKEIYELQID
ncbi:hypothetical protein [Kordia sp. SMS9]|uniref:hypothetical protein n=1 Tax=Kordia sp. SMS9 TaxID=2282170 RepID=UPI0013B401F1|nr:hypothetical protein [Kordia sp. SMS9]